MIRLVSTAFFVLFFNFSSFAKNSEEIVNLSKIGFSKFECSILSLLSNHKKGEFSDLFKSGMSNFREFLELTYSYRDKEEMNKSIFSNVDIGIVMNMGGPNIDFDIGRIYAVIFNRVYSSIENSNLDLQRIHASNKFYSKNCNMLK